MANGAREDGANRCLVEYRLGGREAKLRHGGSFKLKHLAKTRARTPHFSPHGLRRRRGSLHYKRTGSLADVAELLGDTEGK